jgi:hypothetical protein
VMLSGALLTEMTGGAMLRGGRGTMWRTL